MNCAMTLHLIQRAYQSASHLVVRAGDTGRECRLDGDARRDIPRAARVLRGAQQDGAFDAEAQVLLRLDV